MAGRKGIMRAALLSAMICLLLFTTSDPVFAGRHWLGGSKVGLPKHSERMTMGIRPAGAGSTRVFSVVVSLENDPAGDNDPSTEDDRTPYEEILGYFADGVYEATEGVHKIGRVSIYTKGRFSDKVDVVWTGSGRPNADVAGWKQDGHIRMFDVFANGYGKGHDKNFITDDQKGGGYTLAHEWGHYAYGLRDEYRGDYRLGDDCSALSDDDARRSCEYTQEDPGRPRADDLPVSPSIMHQQYAAKTTGLACSLMHLFGKDCGYGWLNYSIAYKNEGGDFRNTLRTGQNRIYGDGESKGSAWETLARDPKDDPKSSASTTKRTRKPFPELASAAPDDEPSIDLPNADARSELEVVWMSEKLSYQIVLDRSGSMGGESGFEPSKLPNAKAAAKFLIDVAEVGKTAIGIVAFDTYSQILAPITEINNESDKNALKSAIDSMTSFGATAMYDAAMDALDGIATRSETEGRAVFLLTDGVDNRSYWDADDVVSSYQAHNIPLFAFAYGNDADAATLAGLARDAVGKFYSSPTSLPEIVQAFNDAKQVVTSSVSIDAGGNAWSITPFAQTSSSFEVDSTIAMLSVNLSFNGASDDLFIWLINPEGASYPLTSCFQAGTGTACSLTIDAPAAGTWEMNYVSLSATTVSVTSSIEASNNSTVTYTLSGSSVPEDMIQYPTPIVLLASLNKELPIAGAMVSGTIEFPDGTIRPLAFADNGVAPDHMANDGNYSAVVHDYTMNGVHRISIAASNASNSARFTHRGLQLSVSEDGSVPSLPADIPVDEPFQRTYTFQITVQGVVSDDHGNGFSTSTPIEGDNTDHSGRIESAGDVDFFKIIVPDPWADAIVIRVTHLSPGMIPVMKIYDHDYNLVTQRTYSSGNKYVFAWVIPNGSSVLYASVGHNGDDSSGTYSLSAGPAVATDYVELSVTKTGNGEGSITSSPVGIDCGADCNGSYTDALSIILTAQPATGSAFLGWTGCDLPSGDTCEIFISNDTTVNAGFSVTPFEGPFPPKISLSPSSLNFGQVKKGASATRVIAVKNKGDAVLAAGKRTVAGANQGEFSETGPYSAIVKGESFPITVTFTPTSYGSRAATLTIPTNDPKKPHVVVKLKGVCPPPKISVVPKTLNFGTVSAGTSATKMVAIGNTGLSDLTVTSVSTIGHGYFSQSNLCSTIAKGATCTITVVYAPDATGSATGSVIISSDDPAKGTVALKLRGKAE